MAMAVEKGPSTLARSNDSAPPWTAFFLCFVSFYSSCHFPLFFINIVGWRRVNISKTMAGVYTFVNQIRDIVV